MKTIKTDVNPAHPLAAFLITDNEEKTEKIVIFIPNTNINNVKLL